MLLVLPEFSLNDEQRQEILHGTTSISRANFSIIKFSTKSHIPKYQLLFTFERFLRFDPSSLSLIRPFNT